MKRLMATIKLVWSFIKLIYVGTIVLISKLVNKLDRWYRHDWMMRHPLDRDYVFVKLAAQIASIILVLMIVSAIVECNAGVYLCVAKDITGE